MKIPAIISSFFVGLLRQLHCFQLMKIVIIIIINKNDNDNTESVLC